MKKIILIISMAIILSACAPCDGPFPDHVYSAGDVAVFKKTGEQVRIIVPWRTLGSRCNRKTYGHYTVRFSDGGEIDVDWHQLGWRV